MELYPSELSGGMKKRASLARALSMDPELVFFDEPSAGLDPVTAADLDQLILRLKEAFSMTLVVVTHEMESAFALADRLALLHEGRFIIADTPEAVRTTDHPEVRAFLDRRPSEPADGGEKFRRFLQERRVVPEDVELKLLGNRPLRDPFQQCSVGLAGPSKVAAAAGHHGGDGDVSPRGDDPGERHSRAGRGRRRIGARAAGRIEVINVEEGVRVSKSQVLAVLEHKDMDAALAASNQSAAFVPVIRLRWQKPMEQLT